MNKCLSVDAVHFDCLSANCSLSASRLLSVHFGNILRDKGVETFPVSKDFSVSFDVL